MAPGQIRTRSGGYWGNAWDSWAWDNWWHAGYNNKQNSWDEPQSKPSKTGWKSTLTRPGTSDLWDNGTPRKPSSPTEMTGAHLLRTPLRSQQMKN